MRVLVIAAPVHPADFLHNADHCLMVMMRQHSRQRHHHHRQKDRHYGQFPHHKVKSCKFSKYFYIAVHIAGWCLNVNVRDCCIGGVDIYSECNYGQYY